MDSPESTCPFLSGECIERPLDLNELIIKNPAATFFVRAASNSMAEAGIHAGDIVVVDRSLAAAPGKIVLATYRGEFLLRLLNQEKQPEDFQVWGIITYVIRRC